MKKKGYDTIVVGLGAMGSATIYQLAQQGNDVLGIDQYQPPHSHGSSHGETRLTRLAVGEGESYVPLVHRSHEIWRELEEETGKEILNICGGLMISSEAQTSVNHVPGLFKQTVAIAKKHKIKHPTLDAEEIRSRFPQFDIDDDERGYFEHNAGYVFPDKCISTQLELAQKHGAAVHTQEQVVDFESNGNQVTVTTDNGEYRADNLVLAAGPWLPEMVDKPIAQYFAVYRQILYWFDVAESDLSFTDPDFPVFIWELKGDKKGMYGFPSLSGDGGQIKVATDQYQQTTTPDEMNREVAQQEVNAFYQSHASHINDLDNKCLQAEACMYTLAPDSGFVIDTHPDYENVVIVSPCSGHGFKHSAGIGEAVSQLVANGESEYNLRAFSLDRFE